GRGSHSHSHLRGSHLHLLLLLSSCLVGRAEQELTLNQGEESVDRIEPNPILSKRPEGRKGMAMALLKVYADRLSQPSRAIIILCKVNRIDFQELTVDLAKGQHRAPEFTKINPMAQVPTIVDGRFKLFERYFSLYATSCVFI
uniref:GST N-terminal domain-containing protein n=1 Tax=Triticum urartu TaxID=4572 RepID=A0A8R7UC17_TRIUA